MNRADITPEVIRRFAVRHAIENAKLAGRYIETTDAAPDNPAFDIAHGDACPMCVQPTLYRFKGGFADEPPGLPHANCTQCGYVE